MVKVKSIIDQVNVLRSLFPGLVLDEKKLEIETMAGWLPRHSEGWFGIPRWQKVAPTYGQAVQVVLDALREKAGRKKFENCCDLGKHRLRQTKRAVAMSKLLNGEQHNRDIVFVPAQRGRLYPGCSVRRVREVFDSNEFGLGAFEVGITLLTHPEPLQQGGLRIDCPGDEYSPGAGGRFGYAPSFWLNDGVLWFGARQVSDPVASFGSATGFLPQAKVILFPR